MRFAVRGAAADFNAWAARGNPGWAWADVLPAFRRLESDIDFGGEPSHASDGPLPIARYPDLARSDIHRAAIDALIESGFEAVADHNDGRAVGIGPMPMSVRGDRRATTFGAYLSPGKRPPALSIRSNAEVDSVLLEGHRSVGVRLVDGTEVRAGIVILAAGTYGSPMILMRSGIGPANHLADIGIATAVDLNGVGANLADHPGIDFDSGWRGAGISGPLLHSIGTFRSSQARPDGPPDMMFWLTDPDAADPGFYLDPVLLKPLARGSVRLRSARPGDPPRIKLPSVGPADLERLVEGYRLAIEIANRPAIRALCSEPAPEMSSDLIESAYSIPHVVGTCRMCPSPADGDVVDHLGRVHGTDGLHVIDASIIPDAPSGFPHVITIMAAEHLALRLPL
jgi:choline dehydrogenase